MGITSSCAECEAVSVDGVMKHRKNCSGYKQGKNLFADEIRLPATIIKFDTAEEHAEWLRKLSGGSANTKPLRELAQTPKPTKPNDEELKEQVWRFCRTEEAVDNLVALITKREHLAELKGRIDQMQAVLDVSRKFTYPDSNLVQSNIHNDVVSHSFVFAEYAIKELQQQLEEAKSE